jgi:2',3'-cyclic-nucleotide 2'-phosphodiesterase (5'-nucleotidase family)
MIGGLLMKKRIFSIFLCLFTLCYLVSCGTKKLETPEVILMNEIAKWDSIDNASYYEVDIDGNIIQLENNINTKKLEDGQSLKVRAIGDKNKYRDSDWSNTVTYKSTSTIKLDIPVITISNDGVASWDSVSKATKYVYMIDDKEEIETNNLSVQLEEGQFIKVKAIGDGNKIIDSNYSKGYYYISNVTKINDLTSDEEYSVFGSVVGINNSGFIVADDEGYVLVYKGSSWKCDLSIGDLVKVTGETSTYAKAIQFNYDAIYKVYGRKDVDLIPLNLDDDLITEISNMSSVKLEYITYSGILTVNTNSNGAKYYSIKTNVSNVNISIMYSTLDLSDYNGKYVSIEGFVTGLYVATNKNINVSINSIYESVSHVNFLSINDTHGAFVDSKDSVSIGRVDSLLDSLTSMNGEYIKIHVGDAFQGSYVSGMTYGLPLIESLNIMEFDCFVLGNHEFDWGIDKIQNYADGNLANGEANFPFLGANIYKAGTTERPDWIDAYTIVNYGNIEVGIIGVIGATQESSILTKYVEEYEFVDPLSVIEKYAKELRNEKGCEVVVVATHDYDKNLNKRIGSLSNDAKIDTIFCAHTHQKVNETVSRADGKKIPVVQNLHKNNTATGVILSLDSNYSYKTSSVAHYNPNIYNISDDIASLISKYQDYIDDSNIVLGNTSQYISKSTLGKYATDAMVNYIYGESMFDGEIDVSIMNTGGIRATIDSGDITKADIFEVFPFNNIVVLVNINGKSLKSIYNANKSYLYFDFADSLTSISSLNDNEIYQLAIIDYVFESTYSSYDVFDKLDPSQYIVTDIIMRDILIEYLDNLY